MQNWWEVVGQSGVLAGLGCGFAWAIFSAARRRKAYRLAGLEPSGQGMWLLLSFVSMSSYLALVLMLGLLAAHGVIARELTWLLVGLSAVSFCSALGFSNFHLPREVAEAPQNVGTRGAGRVKGMKDVPEYALTRMPVPAKG